MPHSQQIKASWSSSDGWGIHNQTRNSREQMCSRTPPNVISCSRIKQMSLWTLSLSLSDGWHTLWTTKIFWRADKSSLLSLSSSWSLLFLSLSWTGHLNCFLLALSSTPMTFSSKTICSRIERINRNERENYGHDLKWEKGMKNWFPKHFYPHKIFFQLNEEEK